MGILTDTKFEAIAKANTAISTLPIHGKEYAEVNQRVKAFRMVYPTGFIHTNMDTRENGLVIFRCDVGFYEADGNMYVLATGTAYEKENATQINRTSYIENCETSAVGRALGLAGFGIETSICSAEELQNALAQQQAATPAPTDKAKPKPAPKKEPNPVPVTDTPETEYRKLALQAFTQKQLDASCKRKFGTTFAETPVEQLKMVMPEDMLRAQIDKKAEEATGNESV